MWTIRVFEKFYGLGRKMKIKIVFTVLALMCLFSSISMVFASQETRLNIAYPVLLNSPSIYGNYVTWSDEHGNSPIAYDLKARKEINIPSPDSMGGKVPMYGNNIVWSLHGGDIALYNVATKQTTIIPAGFSPSIYGNIVAYEGNSGIYTYDVSSKKNTQTSTSGTDPRIYGNNIVYVDNDQIWGFAIFLIIPLFPLIFNIIPYFAKNLSINNLISI